MRSGTPRPVLIRALLTLLWLAGLILAALWQLQPPAPRLSNAAPAQFSAGRALLHVRALAALPHPIGTPAHDAACDYILAQLRLMGVTGQTQAAPVVADGWQRPYRAANVRNVFARLPGRDGQGRPALLLVAHYDSVPTRPGASDDAASAAALLETVRALQSDRAAHGPPAGDIVLLWTDAEEPGLMGARVFTQQPPFPLSPSPLVLNFEARGVSGPSLMFETGPENGALVREYANAAPQPTASSLFYAVYKILPNDSDFTEFRKVGMRGLNFAFIDGLARYHTARDDAAHLSPASLQQQGDIMLALARRFSVLNLAPAVRSDTKLADAVSPDAIYFNVTRSTLAVYPESWAVPLACLATLLTIALLICGLRVGCWTGRGLIGGMLCHLAAIIVAAVTGLLAARLMTGLAPSPRSTLYAGNFTLAGTILLALGLTWALWAWIAPRFRQTTQSAQRPTSNISAPDGATVDMMLLWLALTWLTTLKLTGGSYLFVWPLLFALAASFVSLLIVYLSDDINKPPDTSKRNREGGEWTVWIVQMIAVAPVILLMLPTLCLLFSALSLTALLIIGALVALCAGLMRPCLNELTCILPVPSSAGLRFALPLISGTLGVMLLLVGTQVLRPTPDRPRFDSLFYALDADTMRAVWASDDIRPDAWTTQFLGRHPQRGLLPAFLPVSAGLFLHAPAPAVPLAPPVATLQSSVTQDDTRTLKVHVASPRRAPLVEIAAPNAQVTDADVEGQPVGGNQETGQAWSLLYFNVPPDGITLTLRVKIGQDNITPITLRVVDRSYGLPDIANHPYTPRPDTIIASPAPGWYQDTVLVGKSYRF